MPPARHRGHMHGVVVDFHIGDRAAAGWKPTPTKKLSYATGPWLLDCHCEERSDDLSAGTLA